MALMFRQVCLQDRLLKHNNNYYYFYYDYYYEELSVAGAIPMVTNARVRNV